VTYWRVVLFFQGLSFDNKTEYNAIIGTVLKITLNTCIHDPDRRLVDSFVFVLHRKVENILPFNSI